MIKIHMYAFATGLYFALLQFCYFLGLQINIKSSYQTYMTVVIAWMCGTLLGIWWEKVNVLALCVCGLIVYYAVGLQVHYYPYHDLTMPLATLGVTISGLWAGRFFLHTLGVAKNTDKLFLHENNGFIIGVITAFLGFTTLGQVFLWVAPAVSWLGMMFLFNLMVRDSPQSKIM